MAYCILVSSIGDANLLTDLFISRKYLQFQILTLTGCWHYKHDNLLEMSVGRPAI